MSKSSNVKALRVNGKDSKNGPAMAFDLRDIDLKAVITMGLQDFMFEVGMIAVQQAMKAEVATLAGPRYVRDPRNAIHRWGKQ